MLKNLGPVSDTPPNQEDILSLSEEGGNVVYINASNDPTETFRKHTKTLLDKILSVFKRYQKDKKKNICLVKCESEIFHFLWIRINKISLYLKSRVYFPLYFF